MLKPLTVWITTNCGKFLKKWEYPTTLPASWQTRIQVKKQLLEPDLENRLLQIGKGVLQSCILLPCLFNLYADYTMWNAGVDEAQAGIQIARRNINNLRYEDDTTLMAESKEELKSLLMKVKEESEKASLKLNTKNEGQGIWFHHLWQIDGKTMETVTDFLFLGSRITADGDCSHEIKRHELLGRKAKTKLDSILKSRDSTLLTKVCIVCQTIKAMVFPVVIYGCKSWIIKKT